MRQQYGKGKKHEVKEIYRYISAVVFNYLHLSSVFRVCHAKIETD